MNYTIAFKANHSQMRAFSYAWSHRVTWQRWRLHYLTAITKNPMKAYTQTSWQYLFL